MPRSGCFAMPRIPLLFGGVVIFCTCLWLMHASVCHNEVNTTPALSAIHEIDVPLASLSTSDKSWRQTNRHLIEYRSDIASRVADLASRKADADDPQVIRLAADVIDHVPLTASIGIKRSNEIVKTPQAASVADITKGKSGGFFIECGALDGERSSNTIWLENTLGWTGLLIEVDPFFYTQLIGKNRRVFSANACLSPHKYITTLPFRGSLVGQGRLMYQQTGQGRLAQTVSQVPCFPLESLLAAINQTRVDYFSLDVEGAELDVLKTIPWNTLDIGILSVEYLHVSGGKEALSEYMESVGYEVHAEIHQSTPIFVFDFMFVKNSSTAQLSYQKTQVNVERNN